MSNRRDGNRAIPTRPSIGGDKRQQRGFAGILDRNNHGAIRLHERLSTNDSGIIGRRFPRTPGETSVGRGAHLHEIAIAIVVPFCIAVSIEGATGVGNDKNWSVCDDTASSPFYGHCYTEFDNNSNLNLVQMSTSTNGGVTWGAAKTTPDHPCVIGGQPLVQPNGTVIVPIDDCFQTAILSFRSTDGGNTWSRTVLAAQILFDGDPGNIRASPLPTAEIDKSGRVYIVWTDCRFEAACSAPIGTNDLVLSSSTDGIHWTLPKRIPIDPVGSGIDHLIPGLAVDRSTSGSSAHLGLAYYYFPNSNCSAVATTTTPACQLKVGFISSTNGGASWSAAEHLAGPMNLTWTPLTTQGFMVGDYISTSIVPGDDDATPVFEVAHPPTTPTCSNLTTGAPGSGCDQATYTTPEDLLKMIGGTNASNDVASANLVQKPALSKPATDF